MLLITGGTRRIGRATALLAAERGWSVAINYIADEEAALNTRKEIDVRGGRGFIVQGDVSREEDVVSIFNGATRALGTLDAGVINAGIVGPRRRLSAMDGARIRRMIAVNAVGALLTAREAVRRLERSHGGRGGAIVFVSSQASQLGSPFEHVDYAASKGAIDSLTIGLAKEVAEDGVRVNAVRPGVIDTSLHASGDQPMRACELGLQTPLGQSGTAGEVAYAIMWRLTDEASYTTGTLLDVAGGR